MSIIGIDPGCEGGIATIFSDKIVEVHPMPVDATGEVDTANVRTIFIVAKPSHVYIEKAQPMARPGKTGGIVQTFKFGANYGKLLGIIETLGYPHTRVMPQTWKRAVLVGMDRSTKASSILRARQLFPHVDLRRNERCRTDHDGMAESLLIAWYGLNGKGL